MKSFSKVFFSMVLLASSITFAAEELQLTEEAEKPASISATRASHWSVLVPAFVVHGLAPTESVAEYMPRKLDRGGRSVVTPGIGFEYKGDESFNALAAYVRDCYDHSAGTLQVGQTFKLGKYFEYGYTLGLYIRETPIMCLTETSTSGSAAEGPGRGPGGRSPRSVNTLTTTTCAFSDNLPLRYTFKSGDGYIDIIPSPFLNFSTQIYRGSFQVNLKVASNFYLNEFGLEIPF